jgi:hypothetical protein
MNLIFFKFPSRKTNVSFKISLHKVHQQNEVIRGETNCHKATPDLIWPKSCIERLKNITNKSIPFRVKKASSTKIRLESTRVDKCQHKKVPVEMHLSSRFMQKQKSKTIKFDFR